MRQWAWRPGPSVCDSAYSIARSDGEFSRHRDLGAKKDTLGSSLRCEVYGSGRHRDRRAGPRTSEASTVITITVYAGMVGRDCLNPSTTNRTKLGPTQRDPCSGAHTRGKGACRRSPSQVRAACGLAHGGRQTDTCATCASQAVPATARGGVQSVRAVRQQRWCWCAREATPR